MAINDLYRSPESSQCAMHDSTFERIPEFIMENDTYSNEEHDESEMEDDIIGALKECLEEIDIKVKELFKKSVSNGYGDIPLGRLAREAIGESGAKDFLGKIVTKVINKLKAKKGEDFVVTNKGIGIDDELGLKLERFKVKTVNIGGVIKEEDKK